MKLMLCAIALLLSSASSHARDPAQVRAFRAAHPCPSTGKTTGACAGWVVDHFMPLCAGGADHVNNFQWQELTQSRQKDKVEIAFCNCMSRRLLICR